MAEIDALSDFFTNYDGVKDAIFQSTRHSPSDELRFSTPQADGTQSSRHFPNAVASSSDNALADGTRRVPATLGYAAFTPTITTKDQIKPTIESAPGLRTKHAAFQKAIAGWWKKNLAEIERLPETKNVFELRRHCIDSLAKTLTSQCILTGHQVRGSVAAYFKALESDLQSTAASGWRAELIPEEQILQSQFPEVLVQIEKDQTRIAELEPPCSANCHQAGASDNSGTSFLTTDE